jgi:O-antigen ligase
MLFLNYIVIFYLIIHTVRTRSQFREIVYIIIGIGTFLSVFGLFKMWDMNPFSWWTYTDIGQNTQRLSATYGNPDHLAGYMEMAVPLILGFFLTGIKEGKRLIMIFMTMLMITALLFSQSRGAWIGFLLALCFMCVSLMRSRYFKYKRPIAVLTCFMIIALVILSSTDVVNRIRTFEQGEDVAEARLIVSKAVMKMIPDYALIGSGPGTFAFIFTQYQPPGLRAYYTMAHNDYLHFISELGLAFVIIAIWMMIMFYRRGFKKMKHQSRLVRGITLGSMAGVSSILIHSVGDFNLHIPANALVFTVLSAMAAAPQQQQHISG